jgi:hypothetical protein
MVARAGVAAMTAALTLAHWAVCHSAGGTAMPIRPFLIGAAFEPEAIRNMSVAFESVCAELGLSDKDDPATRLVASKIIEFAQSGVLDAARLRSMTCKEFKLE